MTTSDTPEPTEVETAADTAATDPSTPVAGAEGAPVTAVSPEATAPPEADPAPADAVAAPQEAAAPAEAAADPAPATATPTAEATPTADPAPVEAPADPAPATTTPEAAAAPAADPAPVEAAADPAPATTTPEAAAATPTADPAPVEAAADPAPATTTPEAAAATPTADPAPVEAAADPAPATTTPEAAAAAAPAGGRAGGAPTAPDDTAVDEIDPDAGLGLPEAGVVLGPPNLGGFESGEIVTGTVLTVAKREAEIDLGDGKLGVVGDRHWSSGDQVDLTTVLKTGDTVEAAVLARADVKKRITLSHLWAQQKRGWEAAEGAAKDKSDLQATVTETVKGGLSLDVNGIRAFMPASLVDVQTVNDLAPYIGQTFAVRIIEADRNKARLIVSRKAAMRASQRQQAKAALGDISVGQVMTGKVAQITDFGAFVDVEGVRGLVHKSEIGWSRARDPQRELKVGQEVEVKVLKVQPSRNRLGLTMRTENDPLAVVRKGDRYEATVTRLADFGAFAALPSGVEGLVHVSEMAEYRVFAPEEIVIPGEKVWVKVLKVDRKRRTIDLSMAQAIAPDPAEEIAANEAAAAKAEAKAAEPAADEAPAEDATAADAPSTADAAEAPATEAPAAEEATADAAQAPAAEEATADAAQAPAAEEATADAAQAPAAEEATADAAQASDEEE